MIHKTKSGSVGVSFSFWDSNFDVFTNSTLAYEFNQKRIIVIFSVCERDVMILIWETIILFYFIFLSRTLSKIGTRILCASQRSRIAYAGPHDTAMLYAIIRKRTACARGSQSSSSASLSTMGRWIRGPVVWLLAFHQNNLKAIRTLRELKTTKKKKHAIARIHPYHFGILDRWALSARAMSQLCSVWQNDTTYPRVKMAYKTKTSHAVRTNTTISRHYFCFTFFSISLPWGIVRWLKIPS